MKPVGALFLTFDPQLNKLSKKKELRQGLSAVVQLGATLWVANDEAITLERLALQGIDNEGNYHYADHEQFALNDYLALPAPPSPDGKEVEEADIEGIAYADGYLWLVGSHSRKRKDVKPKSSLLENFARLAAVTSDGNRFLLARIPLRKKRGNYFLAKEVGKNQRKRTAAQLPGSIIGSALTDALRTDAHLQDFLPLPGKDNGFDIEGLAVAGDRVFVGLRGPVLRGWAVILELALEEQDASTLTLKPIGPDGRPYRKHFLDLGGLGIRDLCVQDDNLLVLAGPTLTVAGPQKVFRWPGGARPDRESLVFDQDLPTVLDIPVGTGPEQVEGVTLFDCNSGDARSILVVYDAAENRQRDENTVEADLFALAD